MLIIRKRGIEIKRDRNDLIIAQKTMDGIYLKFADDTEINFKMNVSKEVAALLPAISNSQAKNIEVDLDNPKQPVRFESVAEFKNPGKIKVEVEKKVEQTVKT